MKPCIVALEQFANVSGGQRVLLSIIEGLKSTYDFHVVVPQTGRLTAELERSGASYEIFPLGYYGIGKKSPEDMLLYFMRMPLLIMRLRRLIREKKPRLVYANAARTFVWAAIACSLTRAPLVWHVHSIFQSGLERGLLLFFGRFASVRRVVAVSEAAARPLRALGDKLIVLRNAVDTTLYAPAAARSGVLRNAYGLDGKTLIGMVGLVIEWKGIDDFLRSAELVHKKNPDTRFMIIGGILDATHDSYREYLDKLVDSLGLGSCVTFTGHRDDVPHVLQDLDVYVLASKKPDPCPTALLQAMACGLAVVAPDAGGPREIVQSGSTGMLYPAGDTDALADAILSLAGNPQKRRLLGSAAASLIREKYPSELYIASMQRILRQAVVSDTYTRYNPTWHLEDSAWKARKIMELIPDNVIRSLSGQVLVVDIGCGAGGILKVLSDSFAQRGVKISAEGFDVSPIPLETARASCPAAQFRCGPFEKKLYESGQRISFALLIDILEHLNDPTALLQDAGAVSDYVICHLPLEDNLMVNLRGLRRKFRRTVGHVRFYNDRSAREFFKDNGFTVVKSIYTCLDYDAPYRIKSPLRRILLQPLRKLLFRLFPRFTALVLGNVSLLALLQKRS
jgi:glycosyltransferase involved in cell wall biosynthesis